jgi:acetyl-CoA carboxylase biotin carboxyl carrier protein
MEELDLEDGGFKNRLKKTCEHPAPHTVISAPALSPAATVAIPALPPDASLAHGAASPAVTPAAPKADAADLIPIKSPIVGTFYRGPAPDAAPFVAKGSRVDKDTLTCIIDAMKTMNEIKAGVAGTIMEVLVENGEPVEYDQPLFLVKP